MKTGFKPVLWSGAAFLTLLLLAVPGLNLAALLLMMIPYVVLYTTLSRGAFLLHLLPVWIVVGIIMPEVLLIGLFFLVPSIVMGHLYRKGASAAKVIRTVSLVLLAQLMLELLVFELILDLSLLNAMSDTVRSTFETMPTATLEAAGWTTEMTETLITSIIHMIPLTFILISVTYAIFSHYVARRMVMRSGSLDVPAFMKAKDWRLPRVLVIYYLIAYVINMFMQKGDDSFLAVALLNLVPLLGYVFAVQAIGFFFFIAHERNWSKAVPILIAIPVLLIPPLSLIGVLDTAFPIRKSFTKPK
ncbi:DUF2232 domain-containing protein [Paenibacillus sp. GCM10027627]|uniref:DUF2232 domain-containing protein n=1 Tax=unclassified Paenibacillus TaxID=185978 RepID=UPI003633B4B3